jgi:hypothetical protein
MRRLAAELDVATPTIYWHVGSRTSSSPPSSARRPSASPTARSRADRSRAGVSAALHIYAGAIEHRAITSLAHPTGTSSLLLHDLEAALVAELEVRGAHR